MLEIAAGAVFAPTRFLLSKNFHSRPGCRRKILSKEFWGWGWGSKSDPQIQSLFWWIRISKEEYKRALETLNSLAWKELQEIIADNLKFAETIIKTKYKNQTGENEICNGSGRLTRRVSYPFAYKNGHFASSFLLLGIGLL